MRWKYTKRRVNGRLRHVKVRRKGDGNYLVRVTNHRNYSDRTR